ncbi:MAG: response regulator [Lachnospiraceae bacterium]|nr:response regulator [Lachnospiraceae bacterium]
MKRELNIILVEDDPDTCKNFKEYLDLTPDIELIDITNNSYRAVELAKEHLPDAIILDLELNEGSGNGLLFLQDLKNASLSFKPYILVTTNNSSSATYEFARQLGADFIMSKHQSDYSEKNVIEFLRMMKEGILRRHSDRPSDDNSDPPTEPSLKLLQRLITTELDDIGISPKALGYTYLTDAIILVIKGKTHGICSTLAVKYKKTDFSIERAMQNAINKAWRTTDIDDLLVQYTAKISSEKGVPTLTEFIHYYAKKIKNQL